MKKYDLPYPEAIFELDFFRVNAKPFFEFARELIPGKYAPNAAHFLAVLLHQKDKLLRMYTQNIDGLERGEFQSSAIIRADFDIWFLEH